MLSQSARTAQHSTAVAFSRGSASSTKSITGSPTNRVWRVSHSARGRDTTAIQASFFSALFTRGSSPVAKTAKQEANDLVSELKDLWKSRGDRALLGPNKRIDEIVDRLKVLRVTQNAARSPLIAGTYQVAYHAKLPIPPAAVNPGVAFSDKLESMLSYEIPELGVFRKKFRRFGKVKVLGPNSLLLCSNYNEREDWLGKIETSELYAETRINLLHLDERVLICTTKGQGDADAIVQIFDRVPLPGKTEIVKANIVPKSQPASKPSKSGTVINNPKPVKPPKQMTPAQKAAKDKAEREAREKTRAQKAAKDKADREAREKAIRLERERAAVEREATEKRRAEIKKSVEAFSQRLKVAQENKREAVAALKTFERENASVLRDVVAFKKQMDSVDKEIASLMDESQGVAQKQKEITQELRDCRRELSDLERKLTLY